MSTCRVCGQEIDIRWVDGKKVPIHADGWCPGASGNSERSIGAFRSIESYVNPNAHCPVCGEVVFYYQSPSGGRVFFDALGWPWPKHPCTDNADAQTGPVRALKRSLGNAAPLLSGEGNLEVYEIDEVSKAGDGWDIKFRRYHDHRTFKSHISSSRLKLANLNIHDLKAAPSFIAAPSIEGRATRTVQFISERLRCIATLVLNKI